MNRKGEEYSSKNVFYQEVQMKKTDEMITDENKFLEVVASIGSR
jgi:hypothetical protein